MLLGQELDGGLKSIDQQFPHLFLSEINLQKSFIIEHQSNVFAHQSEKTKYKTFFSVQTFVGPNERY